MPDTALNKMRFSRVLLCSLVFACQALFTSAAWAGEAEQLLERMSRSFHEQTYDGVIAYTQGNNMGSVRVVHIVQDGKESERILHLDGDAREIMRREHDINCIHTGDSLLLGSLAPAPFLSKRQAAGVPSLLQNYRLQMDKATRVAGRSAQKLRVIPKDSDRYSYDLYLDQATGLLLKSVTRDSNAAVLESAQFTQIKFSEDVDPKALSAESEAPQTGHYHAAMPEASDQPARWQASWLPAGFMMSASGQHRLKNMQNGVEALHFTDGLAFLSVFIEPVAKSSSVFQQRRGSTSVYTVSRQIGSTWYDVTVVGSVPLMSAVKISQAIQPAQR
jgi:sigma-E factor negative regulatory protein RseB